jgi:hypothetical protein
VKARCEMHVSGGASYVETTSADEQPRLEVET